MSLSVEIVSVMKGEKEESVVKITEFMGNKVCTLMMESEGHKVKIEFMYSEMHPEILDYSFRINGNPSLQTRNIVNDLAEKKMQDLFYQLTQNVL